MSSEARARVAAVPVSCVKTLPVMRNRLPRTLPEFAEPAPPVVPHV